MKYDKNYFKSKLSNVLSSTDLTIGKKIVGKVRDSYIFDDSRLLIATDRLSAFDVVLTEIPHKGEILTKLSLYWFDKTKDIVENHIVKVFNENSILVKNCEVLPLEVIVRGYLTGSMWRAYKKGEELKDVDLPKGLSEHYKFPEPLVCFTTKAEQGEHDEPISREEIVSQEIMKKEELEKLINIASELYKRGETLLAPNNLILVDTKYEFGYRDGKILLVDEIHTQDSSRYMIKDEFEKNNNVKGLDKEYFRQWLISQGYQGDGSPPRIPDEIKIELIMKYLKAYAMITGEECELTLNTKNFNENLERDLKNYLES